MGINLGPNVIVAQPAGTGALTDAPAALARVLAVLRENEARYAHDVETGLYASGRPLTPAFRIKRAESLARVRHSIAVIERWVARPPRKSYELTCVERDVLEQYAELVPALFGTTRL